jgi:hypothetical protein
MKIPYYISLAATGVCVILCIVVLALGNSNHSLQEEVQKKQQDLQAQQEQINEGNVISQQIGPALLRDMATVSVKNENMKKLLAKYGYNVQVNTPAPGSAGATPAPGAPTPR